MEAFRGGDLEVLDSVREKIIPEEVITDASGKRRWLYTVKRPLVGPDGVVDQVLGVSTDITERELAEDQLRESRILRPSASSVPRQNRIRRAVGEDDPRR